MSLASTKRAVQERLAGGVCRAEREREYDPLGPSHAGFEGADRLIGPGGFWRAHRSEGIGLNPAQMAEELGRACLPGKSQCMRAACRPRHAECAQAGALEIIIKNASPTVAD